MLFADIVGSTELGERHDPELVQSLVAPAFDRLSAEVRRYEGLTEKFVGDAVLALFGVPVAHEDDAERAVRAALEMQRVMREPLVEGFVGARLELRIGIELGEVLVDLPRAARDRDRMVTGDVVNLAARLEQAALPGTVVVGPAIRAATRDLVEYEPLEPILAKGKSEPISAWRAVAVTATRGRPSPFGRESALIGRQAELTALKDAIAQSVAQGRPQLVTILGTAGIGKSRLAWELEKYLDGLPEAYRWLKGRCLAYGQTSYSALAEVLKLDLELLDDDPSEAASVTIERRLEELDLVDADGTIGAALRATLALEPSTGLTREDLFEAWRRYLEVAAGDSPLVLVLEDLHWADEGLLDFVEFLGRWGRASIAIVCLARRELVERRPAWGEGIAQARRIVLDRLSDHEITALVHSLFDEPLPPALIGRVSSAAEGNPLFTEELIRAVVDEQGSREATLAVARLTVPDSIHAVLAARLDNLPRAERRLAHDASVIGRFFWDGAVAHLDGGDRSRVHDRLDALAAKELIIPREPSSLAGESEFGFRHVLIRDVAYETLPKRERAAKHRLVAEWAEVRFAGRLDEVVELLASHYASALEYQAVLASSKESELEPLRHKTLEFARRAGQRAAGLWQLELATRWTRLAVEQGRRLGIPPQELAVLILEYLEASAGYEPVDALLAASEEALELLDQPRDPGSTAVSERTRVRLRARVGIQRADAQYFAGAPVLARAALEDALAQLDDGPPTPERARVLARLGRMLNVTGGHVEARPYLRRAIAEAEATGNREAERWAIHDLGLYSQDKTEGIALMERSLELARAAGDRFLLARCYTNLPFLIGEVAGDWHRAIAISREGAEEAQRAGDRGTLGRVRQNLASFLAWIGPVDEALRLAEAAVRDSAAVGHQAHVDAEFRDLAYMRLSMGDRSGALSDLERAPDVGPHDQPPIRVFDAYLRSLIRWADNPEGAVRDLADALRRADEPDDQAARWLVRMAARTGQVSDGNVGLKMAQDIEGSQPTPFHRLSRAWAEALLVVPPSDAAGQLDGVSAELHATGFPLPAADASCDAALMAGRAGLLDHERIRRAREGYAGSRAVPMLGPMPETRWIDAAVAARSGE